MYKEQLRNLHKKIRTQYVIIICIFLLIIINITIQYLFNTKNTILLIATFMPIFIMLFYLEVSNKRQPIIYYKQKTAKYYGELFVKEFLTKEFKNTQSYTDYELVASNYNTSERKDRTDTGSDDIIFSTTANIDSTNIYISYLNKYRYYDRERIRQSLFLETFFIQYDLNKTVDDIIIKKNYGLINRNMTDALNKNLQHDSENYFDIKTKAKSLDEFTPLLSEYKKLIYNMKDDIELSIIGNKAYITIKSHFIYKSIFKKYDDNYDFSSYKSIVDTIKNVKILIDKYL